MWKFKFLIKILKEIVLKNDEYNNSEKIYIIHNK